MNIRFKTDPSFQGSGGKSSASVSLVAIMALCLSFPAHRVAAEDEPTDAGETSIRAINGEVRLWVNGEEVSGGDNCEPAEGYLCLESEGSPIRFRRMRLRELPR